MSLKGGSADKSGNNYETYWTTNVLCNMLLNYPDNSSIYFEKPGEINDGFEFVVQTDKKLQYFQIKKYQKNWTIVTLCSDGIMKNFIKKSQLATVLVAYSYRIQVHLFKN
ncbi:MAG: dsDNA nuclease domain-containing protein [Candidatus Gastranaerophilales bacterium]|nr:dsDNA nuclease domain-containing protein [Candidatus Gastranaerophilales bacterium]